jgi:hypothetical protein
MGLVFGLMSGLVSGLGFTEEASAYFIGLGLV